MNKLKELLFSKKVKITLICLASFIILILVCVVIAKITNKDEYFSNAHHHLNENTEGNYKENLKQPDSKEEETPNEETTSTKRPNPNPISDEIPSIEGYLKTIVSNNYIDENYKFDNKHITVGKEIKTDKELIREYKITINEESKDLVVSYNILENRIQFIIKLNDKIVEEKYYYDGSKIKSIKELEENYGDIFKPDYIKFITGKDNKEYIVMYRRFYFNDLGETIECYILNENFEKLSLSLDGKVLNTFPIYTEDYSITDMNEYSTQIGYRTEKIKRDAESYIYFTINKDKINYIDLSISNEYCSRNGNAIEYELSISNNTITPKKISEKEIYVYSDSSC